MADRFRRLIAASGPISVARYMAEANAHYYAGRDPLGAAGDFITAPEVSQMFGEIVGLCLADVWTRAGRPATRYVELGPGRGTLAADALRAMGGAGCAPGVELVETSPALRQAQARRLPQARWHDDLASLPEDGALLIVANEFFDALPVRQLIADESGWRELRVDMDGDGFRRVAGDFAEAQPASAPAGAIQERSPAAIAVVAGLASRLGAQGGIALIIDYGHARSSHGDTLQAVSRHAYADPWVAPGTRDLTAHVDFEALGEAADGVRVLGPLSQGKWLKALGIELRASLLARARPEREEEMAGQLRRLIAPGEMGDVFKVMALVAERWPDPAGFA